MEELNVGAVTVRCAVDGDDAVVSLGGELDISSTDAVGAEISKALPAAVRCVVFDLAALEFMDSSGIALMLSVNARVGRVELRNPSPLVRRVVEAAGLGGVLPVVE